MNLKDLLSPTAAAPTAAHQGSVGVKVELLVLLLLAPGRENGAGHQRAS
jgi:hypothetical protein